MTVSEVFDLVELFAGRGGTVNDAINRKLILRLVNARLKQLYSRTLMGGPRYSGTTIASTYEYDLPEGMIPNMVVLDGEKIDQIDFSEVVAERGE